YETETSRTIDTGGNSPDSNQGGIAVVAYGICSDGSNAMKSDNPNSGCYKANTSRTLDGNGGNPACHQGGIAVIEGNGSRPSHKGDGYKEADVMYTLNATEQHGVAYGIGRPAMSQGYNAQFSFQIEEEVEPTIVAAGAGGVAHPVYSSSKASFFTSVEEELAGTLVATDYKDPPIVNEPKYIVRRLTPTECARLQGFPDWWCSHLGTAHPTEEDIQQWRTVFQTYVEALGKRTKPKSDNQIRKWLQNPRSDSAEYKMWGNGVALPNVVFVLCGIAYYAQEKAK
ncbi:MAG: DNA cytosine methyltransferase, partial [Varibaculum cambriense]|nr:DNA cytosine methyltransferase [Varibaculum cambriense]